MKRCHGVPTGETRPAIFALPPRWAAVDAGQPDDEPKDVDHASRPTTVSVRIAFLARTAKRRPAFGGPATPMRTSAPRITRYQSIPLPSVDTQKRRPLIDT